MMLLKIVSGYDQDIPQSQTAGKPMAPRGRATQMVVYRFYCMALYHTQARRHGIKQILTHLAYRAYYAKKRVIRSNDIVTLLKARGKRALADVNCYCKMSSITASNGVTSFLRLKDVTYLYACVYVCDTVQLLA